MQQHIRQVIATGCISPKRMVERVAEPGERLVVPHMEGREHPVQMGPAEAAVIRVGLQQVIIVPGDKLVSQGPRKDGEAERRDRERGDDGSPAGRIGGMPRSAPRLPKCRSCEECVWRAGHMYTAYLAGDAASYPGTTTPVQVARTEFVPRETLFQGMGRIA